MMDGMDGWISDSRTVTRSQSSMIQTVYDTRWIAVRMPDMRDDSPPVQRR